MHTRETTTRKRPPPRDRFDKISLATTEAVSFLEEHGVANERTGRENAATTASINAVEINSRAKQMNHREKQAEQEERRWRTMATTTTSNVAESLKVSKLEIELERLEAQVCVMKKDVRMARADCARERQTVAHERRRCEELTSSSGQTMKENEELRMVLEKTERERDELKRDFVDLGDRW